jgi:hypothetical protein
MERDGGVSQCGYGVGGRRGLNGPADQMQRVSLGCVFCCCCDTYFSRFALSSAITVHLMDCSLRTLASPI